MSKKPNHITLFWSHENAAYPEKCAPHEIRGFDNVAVEPISRSKDYKDRQVDRKKRKVFVTAHVILRTAAVFLASALNRGSHHPEIWKMGH